MLVYHITVITEVVVVPVATERANFNLQDSLTFTAVQYASITFYGCVYVPCYSSLQSFSIYCVFSFSTPVLLKTVLYRPLPFNKKITK